MAAEIRPLWLTLFSTSATICGPSQARRGRGVAVNTPACQAGDRGFDPRRSRFG
jgi:hypothetical protein